MSPLPVNNELVLVAALRQAQTALVQARGDTAHLLGLEREGGREGGVRGEEGRE